MKPFRGSENIAAAAAVISALASLACCLLWGIAAALASLGMAISLEKHRPWLIALSIVLLVSGAYRLIQTTKSCHRIRTGPAILLIFSVIVVFVVAAFPEGVASFMIGHFH
ncbi:MAG TPA: hypothetical protein VK493_12535 [Bryobacteraceae bacterium]|nr:hypothetical protein [Bryobacteraceae bacterium]